MPKKRAVKLISATSIAMKPPVFVHTYTSTACHHSDHVACRKTCKFCTAPCECKCHTICPVCDKPVEMIAYTPYCSQLCQDVRS